MAEVGKAAKLYSIPASYHNGSGSISFADGHAEIRNWVDPKTRFPIMKGQLFSPYPLASPDNRDVAWLQERSTARIK